LQDGQDEISRPPELAAEAERAALLMTALLTVAVDLLHVGQYVEDGLIAFALVEPLLHVAQYALDWVRNADAEAVCERADVKTAP
jgi:hypothetical protein